MKLLVLAQIPPPLHGQSAMVQAAIAGLPPRGIALHHVNLQLSQDTGDIGRWRGGKIPATLRCAFRAIRARFADHCDTLYYIPAPPGKRGALYRDWTILLLCRPFFRRLVLHWHAAGLAEWLRAHGNVFERLLSRLLLGRAKLALVLASSLADDAKYFRARRILVVPNGVPVPAAVPPVAAARPLRCLFLGSCSVEKGLFAATTAVLEANRRVGATDASPAFLLTAAGPFASAIVANDFHRLCGEHPAMFRYAGVVDAAQKALLFATSHALLFPTRYAAEGLPLVALEALAHDRGIVATAWRGLPDIVTPEVGVLVPPGNDAALPAALLRFRDQPPAPRACRTRFLAHFTLDRHLATLTAALASLEAPRVKQRTAAPVGSAAPVAR